MLHRARSFVALFAALAVVASSWPGSSPGAAQSLPFCQPGQSSAFQFGFAALKEQLGDIMGQPIECEHTNPENGDSIQNTTTGLSFYRKRTNTPTFTNGYEHWGLTSSGLVFWTGDSIDPPGTLVAGAPHESPESVVRR